MRHLLLTLPLLVGLAAPVQAQFNLGIGIEMPGLSIGINLPAYPELQRVPGYPVYYAPQADANYFFYDGVYWVYESDDWYASSWYNGPWHRVGRDAVPVFVLRVPVRYYRQPPGHFRGWRADAAPRWGERWGRDWEQSRPDWNRWDRRHAPAPAPLPTYQRRYPQSRYPQAEEQRALRSDNYRYRAREPVVRQQFLPPVDRRAPEPVRTAAPPQRELERETPLHQRPNRGRDDSAPQRPPAAAPPPQAQAPAAAPPQRPPQAAEPQRGPGNSGNDRGNDRSNDRGHRGNDRGNKPDKDDKDDRGSRGSDRRP